MRWETLLMVAGLSSALLAAGYLFNRLLSRRMAARQKQSIQQWVRNLPPSQAP